MDWTGGYVADIGYTAGFYPEMAPTHMAFAALSISRSPGRALRPERMLELGFGQGFGLALLAAANPHVECEGYDFNPEHVAHAQSLIKGAGLTNLKVSEASFEEIAMRGGDNNIRCSYINAAPQRHADATASSTSSRTRVSIGSSAGHSSGADGLYRRIPGQVA